jgi:hypothetical protein
MKTLFILYISFWGAGGNTLPVAYFDSMENCQNAITKMTVQDQDNYINKEYPTKYCVGLELNYPHGVLLNN